MVGWLVCVCVCVQDHTTRPLGLAVPPGHIQSSRNQTFTRQNNIRCNYSQRARVTIGDGGVHDGVHDVVVAVPVRDGHRVWEKEKDRKKVDSYMDFDGKKKKEREREREGDRERERRRERESEREKGREIERERRGS